MNNENYGEYDTDDDRTTHDKLLSRVGQEGWAEYAGHLLDSGRPGGLLARAPKVNVDRGAIYRNATPWLSLDPDRASPSVTLATSPGKPAVLRVFHDFDRTGEDWEPSFEAALGGLGARTYAVKIKSLEHLARALKDVPREQRRAILRAALPHLPREGR